MANSIDWSAIAGKVAIALIQLHTWGDYQTVHICDIPCNIQIKGRLHKMKWVWDGRCEGNGIVGSSRHFKSQTGAAKNAVQDYVIRAGQAGFINLAQIQKYK